MTFAKDSRDLLIECCVEFITLISSEANEIAEKDAKKTIACEHVKAALEELDFGDYVPAILDVAQDYKKQQQVPLAPLTALPHAVPDLTCARTARRSRPRSNRVASATRSWSACKRNFSSRRQINSTPHHPLHDPLRAALRRWGVGALGHSGHRPTRSFMALGNRQGIGGAFKNSLFTDYLTLQTRAAKSVLFRDQ